MVDFINKFINPLVSYHHTADQSIFNILVYKYKFKVFYNENIRHNQNKDRNVVLKIINNNSNHEQYFTNIDNFRYLQLFKFYNIIFYTLFYLKIIQIFYN
jgi:hypothetical protein